MKNEFEMFYNFCGDFDEMLKKEFKKSGGSKQGMSYPQFCIALFANIIDEASDALTFKSIKKKK